METAIHDINSTTLLSTVNIEAHVQRSFCYFPKTSRMTSCYFNVVQVMRNKSLKVIYNYKSIVLLASSRGKEDCIWTIRSRMFQQLYKPYLRSFSQHLNDDLISVPQFEFTSRGGLQHAKHIYEAKQKKHESTQRM